MKFMSKKIQKEIETVLKEVGIDEYRKFEDCAGNCIGYGIYACALYDINHDYTDWEGIPSLDYDLDSYDEERFKPLEPYFNMGYIETIDCCDCCGCAGW